MFPMQAAGLEVAAIPTVIFSNTPNYPTQRGRALPPEFFSDLLQGARERDLPGRADFILTGYIGSLDVALMVADFVGEAKAVNPALIYLSDPVMGDTGPGLYVPEAIAEVMRDRLLPMADIATPNPVRTELVDRAIYRDDLGPGSGTTGFALCARGSVDHHRLRT
nr:bifunctional hydroxymethylpyrimidine kinase/phosphomethylpyrimidine kinase [Sinorhizobium medicae]